MKPRERVEGIWRKRLQKAEEAYRAAFAQTQKVQAELESMSPSDSFLALEKALRLQDKAMNYYELVLRTFTRLILYGEMPEEAAEPLAEVTRPTDFDVQGYVFRHHDFVPPSGWIAHCRELYLNAAIQGRSQDCPLDKRKAIREAFVALGALKE